MSEESKPPLALYVHWPFCKAKCPYCDFNSHVRDAIDQTRWRDALLQELTHALAGFEERRLTSIFFGGGTPSLMAPETVAALIEQAGQIITPADDVEITLEANPTSVEAAKFAGYADAGVNRVSLGIQSLDDTALTFLGREHSVTEAREAIELAQKHFARTSFDLIYARRDQSLADWQAELDDALALAADHISLYQLTIEAGTHFKTRSDLGEQLTADEEEAAIQFELTQDRLSRAGMPSYEISNHAVPGAESRHNLAYWRYWDYVGIGPGAHGRETRNGMKTATVRHRLPEKWLNAVETKGHGLAETDPIEPSRQIEELTLMGLRLKEGISEAVLKKISNKGFALYSAIRLQELEDEGYITRKSGRLIATELGRMRLNAVLNYLLTVQNF